MAPRQLLVMIILSLRSTTAFVTRTTSCIRSSTRQLASTASADHFVSRLSTLQTLLSKHGAPGSRYCQEPNDLVPVQALQDTPELLANIAGDDEELSNLHPYVYPIAKSKSSPVYIGAYRNPSVEETEKSRPWPIVETKSGGRGMRLLALNSEHLLRRIAAQADQEGDEATISAYNDGLGQGLLNDPALDQPYQTGSVEKLGYGVDKYVLLRVGPFPDLYANMAQQHFQKGDEQSCLIAAEAANHKLPGFASTYLHYARTLLQFPGREAESRDAARMCLRLPLSTIGVDDDEFKQVAVLGQIADESDSLEEAMNKLKAFYLRMKDVEKEDDPSQGKTADHLALDEATEMINTAVLEGKEWCTIRHEVGNRFRAAGLEDIASFVDTLGVLQ